MLKRSSSIEFIALISLVGLFTPPSSTFAQSLKCEIGPVAKAFGGTQWLVYSCDDQKSLVVVSAEGNPAMPFYFIISEKDGTLSIYGEGAGSKESSAAAGKELETMIQSNDAVAVLIAETIAASE